MHTEDRARPALRRSLRQVCVVILGLLLLAAWAKLEPQHAPAWLVGFVGQTTPSGAANVLDTATGGDGPNLVGIGPPLEIAVAVDDPEPDGQGNSIVNGVRLYVEELNAQGGIAGRKLNIEVYDDGFEPELARNIAKQIVMKNQAVAVVGHRVTAASVAASEVYEAAQIPAITPTSTHPDVTRDNPWYFRTVYTDDQLARFIAHYVKTAIRPAGAIVVRGEHAYGKTLSREFVTTATDLGTDITGRFTLDPYQTPDEQRRILSALLRTLRQSKGRTAVFMATYPEEAVDLIRTVREARLEDVVLIAPDSFDRPDFVSLFQHLPLERRSPGFYTDGINVATPMIYDTADREAWLFRDAYHRRFDEFADWRAAFAYDAARTIAEAVMRSRVEDMGPGLTDLRAAVRGQIAAMDDVTNGFTGITGPIYFSPTGDSLSPARIGRYEGGQLVSALTQFKALQFLGHRSDVRKLMADGRMIDLNGQLMKRTDIVFTGAIGESVQDLDTENMTVDLSGSLWFRFQQQDNVEIQHDPSDIVFLNAVGPIEQTLIEKKKNGDGIVYQRVRFSGTFRLNFVPALRQYRRPLLGIAFRHRYLPKSDLVYVSDLRGLGLSSEIAVTPTNQAFRSHLESKGWQGGQTIVYQDVEWVTTKGDPIYLDTPGGALAHSAFVDAIRMEPVRGVISDLLLPHQNNRTFLIGSAVFLLTIVLGEFLKRRAVALALLMAQFLALAWALSTGEHLLLDALANTMPFQQIDMIARLFEAAWWLLPACYLVWLLNRFAWPVLEQRTQRAVPRMIKILCAGIILLLALLGVIAFVYEQPITSLLATSGLVGLIFGLAAQSNLSNVFSGIVMSIERPFAIGDVIEIQDHGIAKVTDVTWRTTRLITPLSFEVSIPNNAVAEGFVRNYSRSASVKAVVDVQLPPSLPIAWVTEKIKEGIEKSDRIPPGNEYGVEYAGGQLHQNRWSMNYQAYFFIDSCFERGAVCSDVLHHIWQTLADAGVTAKLEASRPAPPSSTTNVESDGSLRSEDSEARVSPIGAPESEPV